MQQNCCGGQLTKKDQMEMMQDLGDAPWLMMVITSQLLANTWHVCENAILLPFCHTFWMTSFSKLSFLCLITTQTKGKDSLKTCWRSDRTDQNPTFMSMLTIQRESNHKTLLINPFVSQYCIHPFICGFPFSQGIKNH